MNDISHINQYFDIIVLTRHSLLLSLAALRCSSFGDVSFVVIFLNVVNRFDIDTRQMNIVDSFEYKSNCSCHLLKEKKQNFPFSFPLSHNLALLAEKKKKEKKE